MPPRKTKLNTEGTEKSHREKLRVQCLSAAADTADYVVYFYGADGAAKGIARMLPATQLPLRNVHRVAGLGSLGRQRFVALAQWHSSSIAREAKAMAP